MKSMLSLTVVAAIAITAAPVRAQQTVSASPDAAGAWRLAGARHVTPTGPGRSKHEKGTLVSDSQRQEVVFVSKGKDKFNIPFDRVAALHYEEDRQRILFWHLSSFYVTVHYTDPAGDVAAEAIRVSSQDDAIAAITILERDTGQTADRTAALRSFRGIPIRAAVGSKVVVAEHGSEAVKGTITHLTPSSLTVDVAGVSRMYDEHEVSSIRLQYSPGYDAKLGFLGGATVGAAAGGLMTGAFGGSRSDVFAAAALTGAAMGGAWALLSVMEGAAHYPHNNAFDVYRASGKGAPGQVAVRIAPQFDGMRRAVVFTMTY